MAKQCLNFRFVACSFRILIILVLLWRACCWLILKAQHSAKNVVKIVRNEDCDTIAVKKYQLKQLKMKKLKNSVSNGTRTQVPHFQLLNSLVSLTAVVIIISSSAVHIQYKIIIRIHTYKNKKKC